MRIIKWNFNFTKNNEEENSFNFSLISHNKLGFNCENKS
jgi:hypothetical protein